VKPAPFRYVAAESLEHALAVKAEQGDDAKFLAGGQSLVPAMNFRLAQPAMLIDLNGLHDLDYVRADGTLRIGALARHRTIERDALIARHAPLLHEAAPHVAHPQIRNRGTLCGNLAHADPASEFPAVVLALGGRLRAQSARGERWIPGDAFFKSVFTTALSPGEMLVEIELPALPVRTGTCFLEVARRRRPARSRRGGRARPRRQGRSSARRAVQRRGDADPRHRPRYRRRARAGPPGHRPAGQRACHGGVQAPPRRGSDPACASDRRRAGGRSVMSVELVRVATTVNGTRHEREVEPRLLLADFIRHDLGLTGTHVGCEHGVCGACTILVDGVPMRACLMFAVQANGSALTTVEGLAPERDRLHPLQEAFRDAHGLQCGFCTPGILMTMKAFLAENANPTEAEIREALSGNLCRCTGYQHIVDAVKLAAERAR
jgi:xanthine dehydrogenase iron-sulfur cluster and FAD-binding subunit A